MNSINVSLKQINGFKVAAYAALAVLYIPTFYKLFDFGWKRADYSHGPLILVAFFWLLWRKRELFTLPADEKPHFLSFALLLVGLFFYAFGAVQKTILIESFSLIPVLLGTTGFLLGRRAVRLMLFPAVFLLFLVPPPLFLIDMITSPLKKLVAVGAEQVLQLLGYTISRNGVILYIGDYNIVVGDACSGLRSLISLMAVGAVYSSLRAISHLKRSVLFISILPISIIANIFRLILLALITYYFGEAAGQGFFHDFSGILLFIIALAGLVVLDALLERSAQHVNAA